MLWAEAIVADCLSHPCCTQKLGDHELDSAEGLSEEMRLPMVLSPLHCAEVWGKSPHAISTHYRKGAGETLLEFSSRHD